MAVNFKELGAADYFIKRLEKRGIKSATDIQCKVIPILMQGENIFFTSATGTGKTFAYLLPILTRLLEEKSASSRHRFLIIAPTLELCSQIKSEIDFLTFPSGEEDNSVTLKSSLLIGSANLDRQIEELKKNKSDVIIGNPGRLLVLAKMKKLDFPSLKYLVLDEADRLVSDEMLNDTGALCDIIRRAGAKNNVSPVIAACSATINKKNREKLISCLSGGLQGVKIINSDDHEILRGKIEHWAIFSEKRRKDQTLRSLLAALKAKKSKVKALIFTSRNDEAGMVLSRLQHHHVAAQGLFAKAGNKKPLSNAERKAALDSFREGKITALVSTDLAARGLDIPGITHVISLDVPDDSEVYIHRSGRTARAGKRGVMITIGNETQMRLLAALEKKLKIKVYPKELHYGQIAAPYQE